MAALNGSTYSVMADVWGETG
ncbi:MAG: hypothetical protein RI909_1377, partial [Bacteroidota bacterium]